MARYPEGRQRSAVMPLLYLAQSVEGHVTRAALQEVAGLIGVRTAEVEAVASFYTMLRLRPTGTHLIAVCTNLSCALRGAKDVSTRRRTRPPASRTAARSRDDGLFTVHEEECLGVCELAPVVAGELREPRRRHPRAHASDRRVAARRRRTRARPRSGRRELQGRLAHAGRTRALRASRAVGACSSRGGERVTESRRVLTAHWDDPGVIALAGYEARWRVSGVAHRARHATADELIQLVKDSGLRGRGGAGFPTGMKWSFVPRDTGKPTYVTVNFDESEPGTCNNRELVEREPHALIEGTAIAAKAIDCHLAYIYIRGEYLWQARVAAAAHRRGVRGGLPRARHHGWELRPRHRAAPGRRRLHLRRGDGAAFEPRGLPRPAAPAPAVPGGRGAVRIADRDQQRRDADERASHREQRRATGSRRSAPRRRPARRCSRSAARSSAPATTSFRWARRCACCSRTTRAACSAARRSRPGRRAVPRRRSSPPTTSTWASTSSRSWKPGSLLGTGAIMVLDETDCMVEAARRLVEFYAHESCGKCTPCREGTWWATRVLGRIEAGYGRDEDLPVMADMGENILFRAFCALADGAVSPIQSDAEALHGRVRGAHPRGPLSGHRPRPWSRRGADAGSGDVRDRPAPSRSRGPRDGAGDHDAHDRRQGGHRARRHADHPRRRAGRASRSRGSATTRCSSPSARAASATSRSRASASSSPRARPPWPKAWS